MSALAVRITAELSLEAARAERDAVLRAIAHDEDGLRMRAEKEGLCGAEMAILEDLDRLDHLLGA